MATTPLGGRLPNVNRKGPSPCVGGGGGISSTGSSNNQRKQERVGSRDHRHHNHHHQSRVKPGQRQKQQQQTRGDQKASTVAAHAGELDPTATNATNNFEYDDNEWDIGIGDLIIDLDADIEKTRDEKLSSGTGMASTPASAVATTNHQIQNSSGLNSSNGTLPSSSTGPSLSTSSSSSSSSTSSSSSLSSSSSSLSCNVNATAHAQNNSNASSGNHSSIGSSATGKHPIGGVNNVSAGNPGKMAVEHSATVDKGLKMKIKRTKPGTKTSEAKHEIVKSNEINGTAQDGNVSSNSNSSSSSSTSSTSSSISAPNLNSTESQNQVSSGKNKPSHPPGSATGNNTSTPGSKRGSSGHRRDKARDKHEKPQINHVAQQTKPEMNGTTRPLQNHASSISSCVTTSTSMTTTSPATTCSVTSSSSSLASSAPSAVATASSTNTTSATSCTSSSLTSASSYSSSASPNSSASSSAIAAVAGSASNQPQGPTPAATAPQQQQPQGPPPSSRTGGFPANQGPGATANSAAAPCPPASPASATAAAGSAAKPEQTKVAAVPGPHLACTLAEDSLDAAASPPPAKKFKTCPKSELKDMSDVCVGTSVGTITEPECLGPCEPGTSVTLEGIVWHETEGAGVLVVNVTWRGKTYVGTLLDCTRHDWAPPRFCDSPTSDLDARTPKGRGKRGRAAANATPGNDLSNFTETRSSVHSKLRNGGKGRRGAAQNSPAASPSPASTSVVTATATTSSFVPPRPDPAAKRKSRGPEEEERSKRRAPPPTPPSGSPPASPILLECPEPNCSKKYKHINGLKYHQSHAHGSADDDDTKEGITSMSENDESNIEAPSPATPVKSPSEKLEAVSTPVRVASPTNAAMPPETPPPPPRVPSPNAETPSATTVTTIITNTTTTNTTTTTVLTDKSIVKPGVLRFGQEEPVPVPVPVQANAPPPRQSVQQPQPVQPSSLNPPSPNPRSSQSPRPVLSPHPTASIPQPLNIPQPPSSTQLQIPIQNTIVPPQQQCLSNPPPTHLQPPQQSLASVHQHPSISHTVQAQAPLTQSTQLHVTQQPPLQNLQQPQQTLITGQHPVLQSLSNQIPSQPSLQTASSGAVVQPHLQPYPNVTLHAKIPQFKVKPTAALMPEQDKSKDPRASKPQGYKKKSRKSPGGSPHPSPLEAPLIDSAREDVQSPAYSDISDDAAPVLEAENVDKGLKQVQEKDSKPSPQSHLPTQFSMYPYYGQSQYLVPNVQEKGQDAKIDLTPKQEVKPLNVPQMPSMTSLQSIAITDKDKNKDLAQAQQQPQPHYYASYGAYMAPGYPYQQPLSQQQQHQVQEPEAHDQKVCKIKQEPQQSSLKEKQHENHQILKESIEMKSQMNPYHVYHGTQSQRAPPTSSAQIQDDRRYYLYAGEQQRRKEECGGKQSQQSKPPPPSPKHQPKQEKPQEMGKSEEAKIKQEGVKPTMETQGPPPPPTSQYAYIHPGYMPPQHYGTLSFDPGHGVYRGLSPMLVPGPYTGNPYIHQLPRYHGAAEDLSRPPAGKALDLLQHHANQYYSAHKIHELQERALKSPTPKGPSASASPSSVGGPTPSRPPSGPPTCVAGPGPPQSQQSSGKQQGQAAGQPGQPGQPQQQPGPGEAPGQGGGNLGKDNRTSSSPPPPPPRLVHAHHTHLDIGYSMLNGQYPAPYGGKPLVRP